MQTLSPADYVAHGDASAPVLDVRTPEEFATGHLDGAVNVNVMAPDFQDRIAAMGLPKDAPVYLYCKAGGRAGQAAQMLDAMGHTGATNVGGFDALRAAGARVAD